ncbi:GNAT family N-acetyltransferase [Sphingomonas sp. T9W2]|uniref:GNAT family N-acetyltransferase n=1 Tax=Sphingomonas sp. T9W2 TaxID=3143183 RepID=UPI0031F4DBFF
MIRVATMEDVPALHALVESAFRGESARAGWTHEADLLDGQRTDRAALAEVMIDPDRAILMTDDTTGCVQVSHIAPDQAALGLLAVRPDVQAGGLGRRLVLAAEDHAVRVHGARTMEMTVIDMRVELIAWYVRQGYVATGETRPFPMDDPRFGLPRQPLSFVVLERSLPR